MRIPFTQVDVFARTPFGGNPAAVMPLERWLDDTTLRAIAAENNLSETAFLVPAESDEADYDLRWFTPVAEVALCGHATLASGHVLLSADPARTRVRFRTRKAGVLDVARSGADDGLYTLALPAWAPQPRAMPGLVAAMGVAGSPETWWHEQGYAVVILDSEAQVRALAPAMRSLAAEGPILVIATAPGNATDVVSRAFAPAFGVDEDPATGSAHAVIASIWADRLGRDTFTAHQASARGGWMDCRLDGDRVVLTGACVTVIEGTFLLPGTAEG